MRFQGSTRDIIRKGPLRAPDPLLIVLRARKNVDIEVLRSVFLAATVSALFACSSGRSSSLLTTTVNQRSPIVLPSHATSNASPPPGLENLDHHILDLSVVPPYWAMLMKLEPAAVTIIRSKHSVVYALNPSKVRDIRLFSRPLIALTSAQSTFRKPSDNPNDPEDCNAPPSVVICSPPNFHWQESLISAASDAPGIISTLTASVDAQNLPGSTTAYITSAIGSTNPCYVDSDGHSLFTCDLDLAMDFGNLPVIGLSGGFFVTTTINDVNSDGSEVCDPSGYCMPYTQTATVGISGAPPSPPTPLPSMSPTPTPQLVPAQQAILETPEYPSEAPPYLFEDSAVVAYSDSAGGSGTSTVTQRATSARPMTEIPLNCPPAQAKINLSTTGFLSITDTITCPPPGVIDSAFLKVLEYGFNSQTTPAQTLGPVSYPCGGSTCTASFTIHLGSGDSVLVEPTIWYVGHAPGQPQVSSNEVAYTIPVNSRGAAYPQRSDTRYPSQLVAFPAPPPVYQACKGSPMPPGCSTRASAFAALLKNQYVAAGWSQAIFSNNPIEAHHIQPLCWGGNNDVTQNGVYLDSAVHQVYTTWWASVRVAGIISACDESE